MDNFAATELKRYDRQLLLPELGINGQEQLKKAAVLVIGAGGLGSPLLLYLSAAGIGRIGIVDHDLVEESNLQRQVLFHTADIGKNKAKTAALKLEVLNPYVKTEAYDLRIDRDNAAGMIGAYDLVVDGSDNFDTRYLVNDTCVALNKTLVSGSVFRFEGQVSVLNYKGGPDYRALYPEPPLAEEMPNCADAGVIGTLPGIIGSMMANEVIKVVCGFGEVLSGKLLTFNALDNETLLFTFGKAMAKKPDLPAGGDQVIKAVKYQVYGTSIQELEGWKQDQIAYQLIDVREAYEYEEYNIGGTNIPLYELSAHLPALLDQDKIVLCCTTGARSKIAARLLANDFKGSIYCLNI